MSLSTSAEPEKKEASRTRRDHREAQGRPEHSRAWSWHRDRGGLAANLATIPGLRVSPTIPDNPSPPIAIVQLARVQYHQDFKRGMTEYNFAVQVVVGRVDERTAQRNLDAYCWYSTSITQFFAVSQVPQQPVPMGTFL